MPPPPQPVGVPPEKLLEAKAFLAEWIHIVGQASDPVFWDALTRFGQVGDALQFANSQSGYAQMFHVAKTRFNNDFIAMYDSPWRNWLAIARKANENGDYELAVGLFFFAWAIQNQVTFDMNVAGQVGFEQPTPETFRAIAALRISAGCEGGE